VEQVPPKVFDVVEYGGAAADGKSFDDEAIAKTVAAAQAAADGAIAYFPPGVYKVNRNAATLTLRSQHLATRPTSTLDNESSVSAQAP
jgi:polygalacturonase